jgi:uncharacterized membrane protein YeaQ/YmgE (transglycosylase-associated protein family)
MRSALVVANVDQFSPDGRVQRRVFGYQYTYPLSVRSERCVIVLWFIIVLLVVGLIAGGLARLLVPGPDPMSLAATWLLGALGSFVGGFVGYVLFGADIEDGAVQTSGIIGSVIGAVILLLIYRAIQRRHAHRV